jgi:hypothetical protein
MPLDYVALAVQGLITLCFAFVGSYIMWRLFGPKIVMNGIKGSAGEAIYDWLMTPQEHIEISKDKDGKEIKTKIEVTPLENIMVGAGQTMYKYFFSKEGVLARKKNQIQADMMTDLQDPSNPLASLAQAFPIAMAKAAKDGDYAGMFFQLIMPQLADQAGKFVANLSKKKDVTQSESGIYQIDRSGFKK